MDTNNKTNIFKKAGRWISEHIAVSAVIGAALIIIIATIIIIASRGNGKNKGGVNVAGSGETKNYVVPTDDAGATIPVDEEETTSVEMYTYVTPDGEVIGATKTTSMSGGVVIETEPLTYDSGERVTVEKPAASEGTTEPEQTEPSTEAPTEAPAPVQTEAPTAAPAPVQTEAPTAAPAPIQTEAPTAAPAPVQTEAPMDEAERAFKAAGGRYITKPGAYVIDRYGWDLEYTDSIAVGECVIIDGGNASGALVIPQSIDGYKVTAIASGAYMLNTAITSVTVPESVKVMHSYAFDSCENLSSADIAAETVMNCFNGCKQLLTATLRGTVKNVDLCAFGDWSMYLPDVSFRVSRDEIVANTPALHLTVYNSKGAIQVIVDTEAYGELYPINDIDSWLRDKFSRCNVEITYKN
ncbi:MAG: leucine-rich repeat protein [Butyrivibrio sp.]|nr:leucine-rich repeat protein [Butyrivibrio sp.]